MGRRRCIAQVDALCRGLSPDAEIAFREYIHDCKDGGIRGSQANGDFTQRELEELLAEFKQSSGLDDDRH